MCTDYVLEVIWSGSGLPETGIRKPWSGCNDQTPPTPSILNEHAHTRIVSSSTLMIVIIVQSTNSTFDSFNISGQTPFQPDVESVFSPEFMSDLIHGNVNSYYIWNIWFVACSPGGWEQSWKRFFHLDPDSTIYLSDDQDSQMSPDTLVSDITVQQMSEASPGARVSTSGYP